MQDFLQNIAPHWLWLALACLLLAVEVLIVPSGFFLCLGTSAGVVALVVWLLPELSWLWALGIFSALMVLSCWLWWRLLRKRRAAVAREEKETLNVRDRQLVGYRSALTEDMRDGRGRMKVNDSPWTVEADENYPAGTEVVVVEVKGIILKVRALR